MLKLVDKDSEQYHIFEILLAQRHLFTDSTTFPCVLPPEHIFDTPHQYSVVSMPTWGCPLYQGDMQSIQEILRFMQCVLQGLTFLHSNRIAHRDIFDFNIVVNCYRPDFKPESLRSNLRHHRATEDVFYALMDYDQSIQLPLDVSLKSCRRPADEGCYGSGLYKPTDLSLGQPTYNPFAFDVGMLGNFFRSNFPDVVSAVPALAALYDKMTTHLLAKRFTAEEALQFLDHQINGLPEEVLTRTLTTTRSWDALDDSEVYWSQLSPEQLEEWSHFRTPPIPMWSNVLAWFIGLPICCEIIVFSRCVLRL
ncbi:hypothetical protein L227DRAFT_502830 [Lentinus tigrinus ALCF2SS1-6]|uniref:Protein kinase domain-containing protein n=1 Tax=Lentinus tigrinus ALCF2SS1-6 TaxID=1328759 RepID=A0A5C2S7M3_9APHY|nr:hypothetical protein L227DRAFT_502830 [Lentinus tigrinus ALCF2SS1-6]